MADIERVCRSWRLSLEAANKSQRTLAIYTESVLALAEWLRANGRPTDIEAITRADIEGYLASLLADRKAATVHIRYRSCKTFFAWCLTEDERHDNPMTTIKAPIVPDEPVHTLSDDELRRLLKATEGKSFEDRRDNALMRLAFDTGARRGELAGLTVYDVDLEHRWIQVMGKGRRPRSIPFGAATTRALDRYLREREKHPYAHASALWLARKGPLTADGLRQMLERRGTQAGVDGVHAHRFRHSFAHSFLANDGNEGDLMMLAGWRSRQMLNRYGASTAAERAKANYKAPGDRL